MSEGSGTGGKEQFSSKEAKLELPLPPEFEYWKMLGRNAEQGMPHLRELPQKFVIPDALKTFSKKIDDKTIAGRNEAHGFLSVSTVGFKEGIIHPGGKNFSFNLEGLGRELSGNKSLAFVHGHLDRSAVSAEDIPHVAAFPGMAVMALVTHSDGVRALLHTQESQTLLPLPIAKMVFAIRTEKIIGGDYDNEDKLAEAAEACGLGYYVGLGKLSSEKPLELYRVNPKIIK